MLVALLLVATPGALAGTPWIINGVPEPEHPAVISLGTDAFAEPVSFCTGSIITPRIVLTAAHCTEFIPEELITIAGRAFIGPSIYSPDYTLNYEGVVLHPDYRPLSAGGRVLPEYDLSVLILAEDSPVPPIWWRSEELGDEQIGADMLSAGFGLNESGASGVKLSARLTIDDIDRQFVISDNASNPDEANICSGDSGGPQLLWNEEQERWEQISVHSWGDESCRRTSGSTRLDIAADWIEAQIEAVHGTSDRCALLGYHDNGVCDDFCAESEGVEDPECAVADEAEPDPVDAGDDEGGEPKGSCATVAGTGTLWAAAVVPLLLWRRRRSRAGHRP